MNQSHKEKELTNEEIFELKIKEYTLKRMTKITNRALETISNNILDFIKDGKDLEYIKNYCELLLKTSKNGTMEKIMNNAMEKVVNQ